MNYGNYTASASLRQISVYLFLVSLDQPTAMGPQNYKNEAQKIVHFRGNDFCIFFFVCAPLRAGRVKKKKKMRRRSVEY